MVISPEPWFFFPRSCSSYYVNRQSLLKKLGHRSTRFSFLFSFFFFFSLGKRWGGRMIWGKFSSFPQQGRPLFILNKSGKSPFCHPQWKLSENSHFLLFFSFEKWQQVFISFHSPIKKQVSGKVPAVIYENMYNTSIGSFSRTLVNDEWWSFAKYSFGHIC